MARDAEGRAGGGGGAAAAGRGDAPIRMVAEPTTAALFGAIGFDARAASSEEEARRSVLSARSERVPFLVVTETVFAWTRDLLRDPETGAVLAFGVLPDPESGKDLGKRALVEAALRATGSDRLVRGWTNE